MIDATGFTVEFLAGATIAFDFNFDPLAGDNFLFLLGDVIGWESIIVTATAPSGEVIGSLYFVQGEGLGYTVRRLVPVPLPSGLAILPLGLVGLWLAGRRRTA
jgi:hypothetical protein